MRFSLLLALALTVAACNAPADTEASAPADPVAETPTEAEIGYVPGTRAPDFTLVDTNGEEHTLADYRGQVVVLEWLNYDCPFVGKHYGGDNMQTLQAQAEAEGVVWLAVVSSAPGEQGYFEPDAMNARTEQEGGRQRATLLDPTGEVGRMYDAKTTPHMFVIDADGTVAYNGAIDDTPSTDPADLATATGYVLPAIVAARAGELADPSQTTPYGCSVKYADEV